MRRSRTPRARSPSTRPGPALLPFAGTACATAARASCTAYTAADRAPLVEHREPRPRGTIDGPIFVDRPWARTSCRCTKPDRGRQTPAHRRSRMRQARDVAPAQGEAGRIGCSATPDSARRSSREWTRFRLAFPAQDLLQSVRVSAAHSLSARDEKREDVRRQLVGGKGIARRSRAIETRAKPAGERSINRRVGRLRTSGYGNWTDSPRPANR